jgi:fumarate reductase (CoM/CoB) subunit B
MSEQTARGILADAAETCISCGLCTGLCEVLCTDELTIGEVAERSLARDTAPDDAAVTAVTRCSLCGMCCVDCPVGIDSHETMTAAREALAAAGVLSYERLFNRCGFWVFSTYKEVYSISYDDLRRDTCDTIYFPGCSVSAYAPELARRVHAWLEEQGSTVGVIDSCCGVQYRLAGLPDRIPEHLRELTAQIERAGATRLVAQCPHCYFELKESLPGVEVVGLSSLLADAGLMISGPEVLTAHDPCPDRHVGITWKNHRRIFSGHSIVEMAHTGAHTVCCGSGGLVGAIDPELCASRARMRIEEFRATGADCLLTTCANCTRILNSAADPGEVTHYLEWIFDTRVDWADVERKLVALFAGRCREGAAT